MASAAIMPVVASGLQMTVISLFTRPSLADDMVKDIGLLVGLL